MDGGRGDGAYGRVGGRRAELIGDGSRDAVKGRPAKVGFVWPLAYAFVLLKASGQEELS